LAEGRRIERPSLITTPRFSGPACHSAVPSAWRRVRLGWVFTAILLGRRVPTARFHRSESVWVLPSARLALP
jgi:hypothetical protein